MSRAIVSAMSGPSNGSDGVLKIIDGGSEMKLRMGLSTSLGSNKNTLRISLTFSEIPWTFSEIRRDFV